MACDPAMDGPLRPDAGPGFETGRRDAGGSADDLGGGEVMHDLCGAVAVDEALVVPVGEEVTVCPGSTLTLGAGVTITVEGTLRLEGRDGERIQLQGDRRWGGFVISGRLEADFTDVYDADMAIRGLAGSTIRFDDGLIYARATRNMVLANGGTFDRTTIYDGGSILLEGGVFSMTDSTVDLDHPARSPDCTRIGGGSIEWDHVQITNCHCPVHIDRTDAPIRIVNSILDGAAYPVMVADTSGMVSGNVLSGTSSHFQDIGGGIDLDIAGNYYATPSDVIETSNPAQFRGADDRLDAAPAGVGPR